MIFKTKEDLEKRLTYLWDYADKNSDIKALLNELWNDIVETRNVTELNERNSVDEGEKSNIVPHKCKYCGVMLYDNSDEQCIQKPV